MLGILLVVASVLLLGTTAMACPGQVGKVIFEDNFADDSGGWQLGLPYSEIKDGTLLLRPNPDGETQTNTSIRIMNITFQASVGDFCVDFVFPKKSSPEAKLVAVGLVFWRSETTRSHYVWEMYDNKATRLMLLAEDKWNIIFSEKENAGVKLEPDAVNSLRVVAKDGKLTLFLNGSQVKVIRALMPGGQLYFGIFSETAGASDANPTVQVKSFKVTTGP